MRTKWIIREILLVEFVFCLAGAVQACPPPPCPPCWGPWPECNVFCNNQPNKTCCNNSCCTNDCCYGSCFNNATKYCCGPGVLCNNGDGCCDSKACFDDQTKYCCNNGTGKTCNLNETCCGSSCCSNLTSQVSYSTGLSSVVGGIEAAINNIPGVTASGWAATASFVATKGEMCCNNVRCSEYYSVSGSVVISGSVGIEVPGAGWSWEKEWPGIGGIDASLGVTITPNLTVSASASANGTVSDCGTCLTISGSGSGTGSITVTAGGVITLYTKTGWEWLNYNLDVNVSASATASVSASASGLYKTGGGCDRTGFCLTDFSAGDVTVCGTVTFRMLGINYSVTSDTLPIVTGTSGQGNPCI